MAVLILSILVAIAVPLYTRAVERSRTSDPINTLKSIAKAEQVQRLRVGEYTNQTQELDLEVREYPAGNTVAGDTFEGQYYTYKVYGEDEAAATATRKTTNPDEEYVLSVDYGTGELFCRPAENKICIDLGLDEGRDFSPPKWETCAGQVNALWRNNFSANEDKEGKVSSCQVRVSKDGKQTEFDMCFSSGNSIKGFGYQNMPLNGRCVRGTFSGDNKLTYCQYSSAENRNCVRLDTYEILDNGKALMGICFSPIDSENMSCLNYKSFVIYNGPGYSSFIAQGYMYYDGHGFQCTSGNCSEFNGLDLE